MKQYFTSLDKILRGEITHPKSLQDGEIDISARRVAIAILFLAMLYGLCMGTFSLLKEIPEDIGSSSDRYLQLLASVVKVPALFFLTLVVTFPSLYVFNALVGSRLSFRSMLRLLVISLAVNLMVLSSLGLIVAFFSVSTKSYAFVLLLNVTVFTVAGVFGLFFLLQTLHRLTESLPFLAKEKTLEQVKALSSEKNNGESDDNTHDEKTGKAKEANGETAGETETGNWLTEDKPEILPSALDMPEGQLLADHTRTVFSIWVILFSLVGAQMGWVLRPFIGSPSMPFTWFRERQSNFFEGVAAAINSLFGG